MSSFYGGKPGQSFKITKTFSNKAYMIEDLQKKWTSTISVGEYVFVNYGDSSSGEIVYHANDVISINGQSYQFNKDMARYELNRSIDKECIIGDTADGKLFNTTIWVKKYTKDNGEKDEEQYLDKYLVSNDSGLGYYLVASLKGSVPIIDVKTKILDSDIIPFVSIDKTDIENPIITFSLPRAVNYWFGTDLVKGENLTLKKNQIVDSEFIKVNDIYVNKTNGNIWQVDKIENNEISFNFVACFARKVNEVTVEPINPFASTTEKNYNLPTVTNTINDNTWTIKFGIPIAANIEIEAVNLLAPTTTSGTATGRTRSDLKTRTFQLGIPRGTRWFTGTGEPNTIANSLTGDYYINKSNNDVWYYNENGNRWTKTEVNFTGAKGDKGDRGDRGAALNILGSYSSLAELQAAHPTGSEGQAYLINGSLYVWNSASSSWNNVGNIKGEKGDKGDKGDKGNTGEPLNFLDNITYIYQATGTSGVTGDTYYGSADINTADGAATIGRAYVKENDNVTSGDIIKVDYTKDEDISTYWLTYTSKNKWTATKVTGSGTAGGVVLVDGGAEITKMEVTTAAGFNKTTNQEYEIEITEEEDNLFDDLVAQIREEIKKCQSLSKEITIPANSTADIIVTDANWKIELTGNETIITTDKDKIVNDVTLNNNTGTITVSIASTPKQDTKIKVVLIR